MQAQNAATRLQATAHLQGDPVVAATPQRDLGLRGEGAKCIIHERWYHDAARQTGIEPVSLVYWHIFYVICSFVQFSTCSTV